MPPLLEEDKIRETIRRIPHKSFTVLDFVEVFSTLYPEDWKRLLERYGQFGEKRPYTVKTYLSNRLDEYSHRPGSSLRHLVHWSEAKSKDRRRTTKAERTSFGSQWIAVFRKK